MVDDGQSKAVEVRDRGNSMGWFALVGLARGLLPAVVFGWLLFLGADARSLPLATFVIVNPMICAGLGCLFHRYPTARRWNSPSFFATEPLSAKETRERERRKNTFVWAGFGSGIVTALLATSLEVACRGWPFLAVTLIPTLLIYPWLGALAGLTFGLRQGDPKPSIRRFGVSLRTLMIVVAYLALLLGLGQGAVQLSGEATRRRAIALNAKSIADTFMRERETFSINATHRRKIADELRHGRIPQELEDAHKTFLKTLDETASENVKKSRYSMITDIEDEQAKQAENLVKSYDRAVRYQEVLAEKYTRAAREPWARVEPDPPFHR